MPTSYPAELVHCHLSESDTVQVQRGVRSTRPAIGAALEKCGIVLEEDDGILLWLVIRLNRFLFDASASPLRTPGQLTGTVKRIGRDPDGFFNMPSDYAPAAVDRVFAEFISMYPEHENRLHQWNAGLSAPPPAGDFAHAAHKVVDRLEGEAESCGKGRSRMDLVNTLSVDLGILFLRMGGNLQVSNWGERPQGPFCDFLEAVLAPIRRITQRYRYTLNAGRMARHAHDTLAKYPTVELPGFSFGTSEGRAVQVTGSVLEAAKRTQLTRSRVIAARKSLNERHSSGS